jgi:hypothetical protein
MTPLEVSQYIARYQVENLIPGHNQVSVKGEGAVPHHVPAQEPGYVWKLVEAVRSVSSVYEQCDYPKVYRIAHPERWDGLYQYQQENQMNDTTVNAILEARLRGLPASGHDLLTGYILKMKLSESTVPLEIPDPTAGTWKLVSAERDHKFVTVGYELDRPDTYCMTVRTAGNTYPEVYDSRTTDKEALLKKVIDLNADAGLASDEGMGVFAVRKV